MQACGSDHNTADTDKYPKNFYHLPDDMKHDFGFTLPVLESLISPAKLSSSCYRFESLSVRIV